MSDQNSKRSVRGPPPPPPHHPHPRIFKKCKSATFQIDGATYTIGITNRRNYYSDYFQGHDTLIRLVRILLIIIN